MAKSNLDRVGEALDVLGTALEPFVSRVLQPYLPAGVDDWTEILRAKDGLGVEKLYSRADPHVQLRAITERLGSVGFAFNEVLSRAEQNLAGELRDVRGKWAHRESFSSDDTYRALDTAERLLRAIGAPRVADAVRKMKADVQRTVYAEETRRDSKSAGMPTLGSDDLASWRDVLRPHDDIASGNFARSEFAADLHQVANGQGTSDYTDPVEFFSRTYLTEGLKTLLTLSARRIGGDENAAPVINLQTAFGGGKTHSMLAAWHLFSGRALSDFPQSVQDVLAGQPDGLLQRKVKRVAIVGNEFAAGQTTEKPDGTIVRTLWGELAWQLGGAEGYAYLADSDKNGTSPGETLRDLIAAYSPALILIDEWVAYARQLYTREDLPGGTFETQFTFAQLLTEVVKSVPGALLLVSIPASDVRRDDEQAVASDLEVGGANGRAALERLQNVVARIAHNWTPASSHESFEIVKRRLFVEPDAEARRRIDATARRFADYYRGQQGELPPETRNPDYESRIRAAYPIHPELFDRLYGDWSTLERFQRTRGVLRLMSAVVHELYGMDDDSPLIMPGSMPLGAPAVRDEVSAYLDDAWKTIIERDIDGENATPVQVDSERPLFGKRALTRRIARAVFMGSAATLNTSHKGIERQRVFLGVAMPGDTIGNFGSALQMLSDRATYLYNEGPRYWYDRQPSLNRTVSERAQALAEADVWAEVVSRLKRTAGTAPEFAQVLVSPASSADVDEGDDCRLVLLHPRYTHNGRGKESLAWEFAFELIRTRGTAPRQNANTLIALAADENRWSELEEATRVYLAWHEVASSVRELDLTQSQQELSRRKTGEATSTVDQRISATWIWALYPEQPDGAQPLTLASTRIDSDDTRIAVRVGDKLGRIDVVQTHTSPKQIWIELDRHLRARWNTGRISAGELWDFHRRYPYLNRLRDKSVLTDAVRDVMGDAGWSQSGFALADGYDEASGDFLGLRVPFENDAPVIIDSTLLVAPNLALAQFERELVRTAPQQAPHSSDHPDDGQQPRPDSQTDAGRQPVSQPLVIQNVRFEGAVDLRPSENLAAQLSLIAEELLVHLQGAAPDTFEVRLEISADKREGFDPNIARTIAENGRQLGFSRNKFLDA